MQPATSPADMKRILVQNQAWLSFIKSGLKLDYLKRGELNAGMLIYDVMQGCPMKIRTYVIGRAYSMAAFLFISGTGGRYMLPHSEIMLHEPILGNRIQGTVATIRSASEALMEARKHMNELISKHTGRSTADIEKETSYDHFFLPEEAVAFGAADKIISFDQILGCVK